MMRECVDSEGNLTGARALLGCLTGCILMGLRGLGFRTNWWELRVYHRRIREAPTRAWFRGNLSEVRR